MGAVLKVCRMLIQSLEAVLPIRTKVVRVMLSCDLEMSCFQTDLVTNSSVAESLRVCLKTW